MNYPSPRLNIEKLQNYKPNFGKSKINNLIRLSANESALGASLGAIEALKFFASEFDFINVSYNHKVTIVHMRIKRRFIFSS